MMRKTLFACVGALILTGAISSASPEAWGQTPPVKDPVGLYAKGKAAVEKGDFQGALAALEPSYAALPSPNTLLLVAHAKRGLGKKLDAIRDYEHVASDADLKIRAGEARYEPTFGEARKWIDTLAMELTQVGGRVLHAPASATVSLNGEKVKAERDATDTLVVAPVWMNPGSVVLRAEVGGTTREAKADAKAGSKPILSLDFVQSATPPVASAPVAAPEPAKSSRSIPVTAWIAGGVGVAGFAMFGIFGALAKSDYDSLQDCSPRCPESQRSTADSGKTKQTVANVGLVVGGVGVLTAVGLVLFAPKKEPAAPAVGLAVGPGSVTLRGSF
jgi:hypothetical protein